MNSFQFVHIVRHGEKIQRETTYFVTSSDCSRAAAEALLALGRRHWGEVENGLHHVRDTTLQEDRCRSSVPRRRGTRRLPQRRHQLQLAPPTWD
jgi:hypothetical protein